MSETVREGQRIDDEFYGNPFKKKDAAKRFSETYATKGEKMAGHVMRAERFD